MTFLRAKCGPLIRLPGKEILKQYSYCGGLHRDRDGEIICFKQSISMLLIIQEQTHDEGIADDGYRLIINCGDHGNQEVYHLHMHLMGGRPLGPMLTRKQTD